MKSKRLVKAHRMSTNTFFKKIGAGAEHIKKKIQSMPREKLIIITGAVALTGVTGYLVVRTYIKRFDGKNYYLKGWSKDHSKAMMLAENLRAKGLEAREVPMRLFGHTIHRIYARRP